jgi:hypothetical protein
MADKGEKPKCKLCAKLFTVGEKVVKCEGVCGQHFHWCCVKDLEENLNYDHYTKSSNLRLFCRSCYSEGTYISNIYASVKVLKKQQQEQNEQVSKLIDIITKQNDEIIALRAQINDISSNLIKIPTWPAPSEVANQKQKRQNNNKNISSTRSSVPLNLNTPVSAGNICMQSAPQTSSTSCPPSRGNMQSSFASVLQAGLSQRQSHMMDGKGSEVPGRSTPLTPEDPEPQRGIGHPEPQHADDGDDTGFTTVLPRDLHFRPRPRPQRRTTPNFGSAESCPISAVKRKAHLHVWRLDMGTTKEALSNYLLEQHNLSVEIEKLNARGPYASFRVTTDYENMSMLENPSIWPQNTAISKFIFGKNFQNQNGKQQP